MFYQSVEDLFNRDLVQIGVSNQVEVPDDTVGNGGSPSARGSHHCEHDDVLNFHELEVFSVVPALVVEVLSQKLERRLGPELLLFGHVKVVHKNDALFPDWRPVYTLSSFLNFRVDCVLSLICACLR